MSDNISIKRLFDFFLSMILLIMLIPIFVLLVVVIRMVLGRPVLFKQKRPGKNGELFEIIKFRSMLEAYDSDGHELPDSVRLTKFGKFLRKTSLDELPELLNVLKGEMSLVGPRPLLEEYLPLYSQEQARRHQVLPGITGWAQVNGRNQLSWDEKFKLDVWYVDNQSFMLDMKILWLTVVKVFSQEGISADNHVTVQRFNGNN